MRTEIRSLTPSETAILEAIVDGLTEGGIAERLGCARSTVKTHIASIYVKLGVRTRGAAVARAFREGLVS